MERREGPFTNDVDSLRATVDRLERENDGLRRNAKRGPLFTINLEGWLDGLGNVLLCLAALAFVALIGWGFHRCDAVDRCSIVSVTTEQKTADGSKTKVQTFKLIENHLGGVDQTLGEFPTIDEALVAARKLECPNYRGNDARR